MDLNLLLTLENECTEALSDPSSDSISQRILSRDGGGIRGISNSRSLIYKMLYWYTWFFNCTVIKPL